MKNKRKILFAIIVVAILILGVTITVKLNKEGILFGKKTTSLSALDNKAAAYIGDELNTILIGDVNGDGKITTADVNLLKQYINEEVNESKINKTASDANKDGKINVEDVSAIEKYLLGKAGSEFVGSKAVLGEKIIILGDANGDGKVDLNDATLIQKYLVGGVTEKEINIQAADTNKNNKIDIGDMAQIRMYINKGVATQVRDKNGIMWLFDRVEIDGQYYAKNLVYINGYTGGDLVVPEELSANYKYKTVSMVDVAFSGCANAVERIVIPSGVTNINQDLFEGCSALESVIFLQKEGRLALTDDMFASARNLPKIYYYHGVTISDSYTGEKQESPYIYSITCDQNYIEETGNLITVTVKFTNKTKGEDIPYLKMKVGDTNLQLYSQEMNDNKNEITYKYYKNPGLSGEILIEGFEDSSLKDDETGYFYIDMDTSKISLNQRIDTESILINKVSIESNNAISSNRAKVGDTITLTFQATEEIFNYGPGGFFVEIGGITDSVHMNRNGTTYTASLVVTEENVNNLEKDSSGNVSIRIKNYQDQSGNVGATINSTTPDAKGNCSYVKIDTTNPSIVKMEAKGYQPKEGGSYAQKTVLKAGDEVEIVIKSSEVLYDNKDYPVLGIKWGTGEEILLEAERMSTGGVGENYTTYLYYEYTIKEGDNGKLSFVSLNGEMVDLAGNVNTLQVTDFTNEERYITNNVEADTELPYIQGINITLDEDVNYYITKTDEENKKKIYGKYLNIVIDVKFTELVNNEENKIPIMNTSIIKNVEGKDITKEKDQYTTIRYEINTRNIKNLLTGEFIIQQLQNISLTDIAGNIAELELPDIYTINEEEQTLYIDAVAPNINFKDNSKLNTVDGVIYTKYCDLLNDSTITDNYLDAEDITITLKDENQQKIANYTGVQVSDLQSLKLQDGEYYMDLEDILGNTRTVHFVIDNKAPVLNVIYNKAADGHIEHVTLDPNIDKNISINKVKLYEVNTNNINSYGTLIEYNYLTDNIPVVKDEEGSIVSKTYKVIATDYAGNSTTKYFTVNPEDTQVENVKVTYTKNEDGTVIATISSTEYLQEIEGWEISGNRKSISKVYTENTMETVTVEDLCGNAKDVIIKIDNTDTEVENVKVTYVKNEGGTTAIISSTEELRAVEGWKLSYDNKKLVKDYTGATEETVRITDLCGNTKDVKVKIDNTDTQVENVEVTYTKNEDGTTTAIISSREELREVEGWILSENGRSLSKIYSTNTMETVTVEDLCGNTKDVYIKIIDIESPVLEVSRKTQYQYVSDGDEMVIKVHSDKLMKLDEFKVNGKDVTINIGTEYRNDYEVRIQVDSDMPEGDITLEYMCTYNDENEGTKRGSVKTDIYTIDRTTPIVEKFEIVGYNSNKTKQKTKLKAGDILELTLELDEQVKLISLPELKIGFGTNAEKSISKISLDNGEQVITINSQEELQRFLDGDIKFANENTYFNKLTYIYEVGNEDEGKLKIAYLNVPIEDIARNKNNIIKSNYMSDIVADNTAPYITSVTTTVLNIGDANADGNIDQKDIDLISYYLADKVEAINEELADVNRDGEINVGDVTLLEKALSGTYELGDVHTSSGNTYIGKNKEVKFQVNISENVSGNSLPTLTIKVGDGRNITLNNGVLQNNRITYTYTVATENGKINIISLNNGNVIDGAENPLDKTLPEIDTRTYVDTQLLNIKANLAAGDIKDIDKDKLVYLKDFVSWIDIEDLSGIKSYVLKYDDKVIDGYELSHVIARDGNWTLTVRDNAGNIATYIFIIDTTAPIVKLNGKDENNVESIDNIVIDIEDDNIDLDSGITLYKNGSKVEFHYETQTTIYEAGEYRIVATDKAGNKTEKQFTVKRKAPTVNMYLGETQEEYTQDTWTNQSVRIELNVEPNDDVKEIQYRTSESSEKWITVVNNQVILSQTGEYDFEARTKYTNDKYSVATSVAKIKIDKVAPTNNTLEVTLGENTELVQNQWYNGDVSITIPVGTDAHSGIKNLVYTINGNKSQTTSDLKKSLSSQGIYTIVYNNVDNAGNKSQEIIKEIKIDTEAPSITYMNDTDQEIKGKINRESDYIWISDDEILEVNEFTYFNQYVKLRIEDAVSGINSSSLQLFKYDEEVKGYVEYTDTAIMRDGRYIVTVKDNIGYRMTKGFVVDTTSPSVMINGEYPEVSTRIMINGVYTDTDIIKNNYYNSDVEIDILETNTSLVVYKKGTNGNYTEEYPFLNQIHKVTQGGSYKLIATDFVGNVTTVYFIIDRTNPTVEVSPNTTNWTNEDVILQIKATDNESGIGSIVVNDTQIAANNGVGSYSVTENGNYMVVVEDNAGNRVEKQITVNNIDKNEPKLSVTGAQTEWTGQNVNLNITATDEKSGIASVTVNSTAVVINNGTGSYTVTENGIYTIVATDVAGNQKIETITVNKIDRTVPTVTVYKNTENKTEKVILTVNALDNESGVAGYSWDNGQTWITSNTYEVSKNGTYTVRVKDKVGNIAEKSVTISNIKESEETYFRISNYATKEKENTQYIIGISTNTGINEFKQYIQTNMEYTIVDKNGNAVGNDRIMATGMKIKVSDGREYILVVRADLNSDGKADISDLSVMASYLVGKGRLGTTYLLAGDINFDNELDITDISILAGAITRNIKL